MSTAKIQKLSGARALAKRPKGVTSKTAATRGLPGGNSGTDATAPAKRVRSAPAAKRAAAPRGAATAQQPKVTRQRAPAMTGSVRVNFDLEKAVHKRLKMLAVEADMTIADWMRGLIHKELERVEKIERRGK